MSSLKLKNTFNNTAINEESNHSSEFDLVSTKEASGVLNFNIPKSMAEKLERFDNKEKITNISIESSGQSKNVTSEELRDFINNNKKISKITIEEVKANDFKRMNLHFDKEKNTRENALHKDFSVLEIEKKINERFLDSSAQLKDEFSEVMKLMSSRSAVVERSEVNKLDVSNEVSPQVALKLKSCDADTVKEEVSLRVRKQEFKRRNSKSLSKIYYKAINHIELFKLGDTYLQDYNRGIKSIAFNSLDSHKEREKTILGVSSFLHYNAKVTVTVVTDCFESSIYKKHIPDLEEVTKTLSSHDMQYNCLATNGIEIVDYAELWNAVSLSQNAQVEDMIESFTEMSDVILWDLPVLSLMDNKRELFYPIVRYLDNVSIVVKSNISKYRDLDNVKEYFEKYQVPIKGLVLAE